MFTTLIRSALLNPQPDGSVVYLPDAALAADASGTIQFVGPFAEFQSQLGSNTPPVDNRSGILIPAMFDAHIHIPQHPMRGRFTEGVVGNPPGGRLLAGLNRNVFPTESKAADDTWARQIIEQFRDDTRANGVIGGAAYVTVHASAARLALEILPDTWQIGLVLMNQNCPEYLRTDEPNLDRDVADLVRLGGPRLIVTDRFAIACGTPLRTRAAALARNHNLRMQTHINEQIPEKHAVEHDLYPNRGTYTDVYAQDGLLAQRAIMAHCIWMSDEEFAKTRDAGAVIAHCPTSNTLLGSGIMPLDTIKRLGLDYALCTDVGASPTTSLLCEMVQFLTVHSGRSSHATATEALFRVTLGAARLLGLDARYGNFTPGKSLSYCEIAPDAPLDPPADLPPEAIPDHMILRHLLGLSAYPVPTPEIIRLAKGNLTETAALLQLSTSVHATMQRLQNKIQRSHFV